MLDILSFNPKQAMGMVYLYNLWPKLKTQKDVEENFKVMKKWSCEDELSS